MLAVISIILLKKRNCRLCGLGTCYVYSVVRVHLMWFCVSEGCLGLGAAFHLRGMPWVGGSSQGNEVHGNDCGLPSLYMPPACKHLYTGQCMASESCGHSLLFHSLSTHLRRLWAVSPGGKNLTPLNSFLSCKTGLVILALPTSLGCDTHLARLWKRKHVTHTEAVIMNHFGIWGGGWHFHLKFTDGKIEGRGCPPGLAGTQILFP